MKIRYITTALLAVGLMSGCINVKVYNDSKPKHHEGTETEDANEEKEDHDSKSRHHDGKESEDREEKEDHDSKANLLGKAKISESDARQTALAKVPNGTFKEGELEMEKGKLIWSFCFTTPGSKNITEVNVDAITGSVVNVELETPKGEAEEEHHGEKGEKKDKDDD